MTGAELIRNLLSMPELLYNLAVNYENNYTFDVRYDKSAAIAEYNTLIEYIHHFGLDKYIKYEFETCEVFMSAANKHYILKFYLKDEYTKQEEIAKLETLFRLQGLL